MSPVFRRLILMFAALALLLPALAACADDNGDENGDEDAVEDTNGDEAGEATEEEEETEEATETEEEEMTETEEATETEEEEMTETEEATETEEEADAPATGETIEVGLIEWAEGVAVTNLWIELLEQEGYDVEVTTLGVGPLFTGLGQGDIDLFLDGWLPNTHAEYWEDYGENIEDIGIWYEDALLALTVPQYVADEGVTSLADLQDNADTFGSTIIGIEPGAGMMGIARDTVMPTYGIEDWTLTESSTPAMLAELDSAISNEEPIVVTLWEPHWAYSAYDLHNLEDPELAWGEPDSLHVLGRQGFSEDYPQVAEWLGNFEMTTDQIGELMDYVTVQAAEDDDASQQDYARMWLEDGGQEIADEWMQ